MKKNTHTVTLSQPVFWEKYMHIILCATAFILYANTIGNGYNMDDELVTRKHKLASKGISAIPEIFTSPYYSDDMGYAYEYRPVVLTSFAIEHAIFGDKPGVSHFFNVILYVLTIFLLYKLLRKLLHAYSYWISVLTVLLFIVHPLHVEVVASIKNRDEILALLGALGAWWYALAFAEKGKWWQLMLTALLFLGGTLSKMSIVPCLVLIPLSLVIFTHVSGKKLLLLGIIMAFPVYPFLSVPEKSDGLFLLVYILAAFFPWFIFLLKKGVSISPSKVWQEFQQWIKEIVRSNTAVNEIPLETSFALRSIALKREELLKIPFGVMLLLLLGAGGVYILNPINFVPVLWFLLFGVAFFAGNQSQRNLLLPIFTAMFLAVCYFSEHSLYIDLGLVLLLFIYLIQVQMRNVILILCIISFAPFYFYFERFIDFFTLILPFILLVLRNKNRFFSKAVYVIVVFCAALIIGDIVSFFLQWTSWDSIVSNIIMYSLILLASIRKGVKFFMPLLLFLFIPFVHIIKEGDKHVEGGKIKTEVNKEEINPNNAFSLTPKEQRPILYAEMPVTQDSPREERAGLSAEVMGFYLKKMLIPYPLGYYYGYAFFEPVSIFSLWPIVSVLLHIGLLVLSFWAIKKHKILAFGIWFYLLSVLLFSGILYPVVGVAGDRFSYMASIGFGMAIAYVLIGIAMGKHALTKDVNPSKPLLAISFFILIIYGFITIQRNALWSDPLTLMSHDIEYLDESGQAHNLYALNLMRESFEGKKLRPEKQLEMRKEAIVHFDRALQIWPKFFNAAYDKGRAGMIVGDYVAAIDGFEKAVAIGPEKGFIQPYIELANLYLQTGRYADYLKNAKILLKESPEAETYNMVARGFYSTGRSDSAKLYIHKGMNLFPQNASLRKNLAEIFKAESQKDSADYYMR